MDIALSIFKPLDPYMRPIIDGVGTFNVYLVPDDVIIGSNVALANTAKVYYNNKNYSISCPYIKIVFAVDVSPTGIWEKVNFTVPEYAKNWELSDLSPEAIATQIYIPDLSRFNFQTDYVSGIKVHTADPDQGFLRLEIPKGWQLCKTDIPFIPSAFSGGSGNACNFNSASSLNVLVEMIKSVDSSLASMIETVGYINFNTRDTRSELSEARTDINILSKAIPDLINASTSTLSAQNTSDTKIVTDLITSKCTGGGGGGDCDLTATNKLIVDESNSVKTLINQKCDGSNPHTTGISIPQAQTYSLFPVGSKVICGELGSDWEVIGYSPLFVGRDVCEHLYVLKKDEVQINSPAKFVTAITK
ncbi:MAG: hypothetical protein RL154_1165 [Pseudomonadota bacterium]